MDRKKICIRVKVNIIETIKILAKTDKKSFQKMIDEIIELGILEKYKGGIKDEEIY